MRFFSPSLGAAMTLCLSAMTATAHALPDLWRPDDATQYHYEYVLDTTSHGDPFTKPYNLELNSSDPQNLPSNHDTSFDFYLFEPKRLNGTKPPARPLVVYFHGADTGPSPSKQRAQIEHYVRSGFSVLWLPFCDTTRLCLDFVRYEGNAIRALMDGRYTLWQSDHVGLATDANGRDQVVFIAHSLGSHVAARLAAQLSAWNQGWGALPEPKALILHDAAGYTSSVQGALNDAGAGWLYQWAINTIEQNGWGWDKPGGGPRTYEIKDAIPLSKEMIQAINPNMLVMVLAANQSYTMPNAYETARRIYSWAPATVKRAYVVPHQCVSQMSGAPTYGCPSNLSQSTHNAFTHQYYSSHQMYGDGTDNLKESAVVLQTTDCLKQAFTGLTQLYCTGAQATFSGKWLQSGAFQRNADAKMIWNLTAP